MNYIWLGLIIISFIIGAFTGKLQDVTNAMFDGAKNAVNVAIYLIGIMAFWLGVMKIAQKSGTIEFLSKLIQPLANIIFPELKHNQKATGLITMNVAANALGLTNAATPIGLKAMETMQEENNKKDTATNSMCTFLAMNTAGFQIIPATVIAILASVGAKNPTEIILPTLIVTTTTFTLAIFISKILQRFFKGGEKC
ncbi:nucleoside recognition protein [bacterium]|nr:nucleoside recognition protein [bacterium]